MMDNGNKPAGPLVEPDWQSEWTAYYGLTKREWFAGMAMQGLMANPREDISCLGPDAMADIAIDRADSLLTWLAKEVS